MSLRKFEILEMIAKGGMAEVYRAQTAGPEGFAKELCVKKILPHLTEDDKFVRMFINEAKLAASLNFANIVSVHDLCVSANREYFIVMEYVHGKDLSDIIRAAQMADRMIPPEIVGYIGREVCRGLTYAHAKRDTDGNHLNIIHRDISPQNILCSFMGEVKITDFGIAKASTNVGHTAVGILKGKYGYMSPEQAHGGDLDHRSDIFNLGIVLYELLVRERCFAGASDYSTLNLMREATVTPPTRINETIPKELEKIVIKALARRPQDRFQSAAELEEQLGLFDRQSLASQLASFVSDLFSNSSEKSGDRTTGILNLSSVVEPVPKNPDDLELGDENQTFQESVASEVSKTDRESVIGFEPGSDPKTPVEPDLVKEAKEPSEKRKPARLKPHREKAKAKKEKKAASKRPVGRRHLKPAWTDLHKLSTRRRSRIFVQAAVLIAIAGAIGFGLGIVQTGGQSYELAFRMVEAESNSVTQTALDATRPVLIDTVPAGAKVVLDDKELKHSTPVFIAALKPQSKHRLELSLPGHKGVRNDFVVTDDNFTRINQILEPIDSNLLIETEPSGARISINGVPAGKTPARFVKPKGRYQLLLESKKHLPYRTLAIVKGTSPTRIQHTLVDKDNAALIKVSTDIPARLLLDGHFVGYANRPDFLPIEPNRAQILTLQSITGALSRKLNIELKTAEKKQIYAELKQARSPKKRSSKKRGSKK
jgi:serine/threonine protein kinase